MIKYIKIIKEFGIVQFILAMLVIILEDLAELLYLLHILIYKKANTIRESVTKGSK